MFEQILRDEAEAAELRKILSVEEIRLELNLLSDTVKRRMDDAFDHAPIGGGIALTTGGAEINWMTKDERGPKAYSYSCTT